MAGTRSAVFCAHRWACPRFVCCARQVEWTTLFRTGARASGSIPAAEHGEDASELAPLIESKAAYQNDTKMQTGWTLFLREYCKEPTDRGEGKRRHWVSEAAAAWRMMEHSVKQ
eukprot:811023-Amphidinium_carterae.1